MTDASKLDTGAHGSARECTGTTNPDPTPAQARTVPEKEEEKKKEEEARLAPLSISKEVIGYLNKMAGPSSKQRPAAKSHRKLIQARLNDGATVDDLKTVIRKMCAQWADSKMAGNLKPSCLFRASNFDGYLGQPDAVKGRGPKQSAVESNATQQDFVLTPELKEKGWR